MIYYLKFNWANHCLMVYVSSVFICSCHPQIAKTNDLDSAKWWGRCDQNRLPGWGKAEHRQTAKQMAQLSANSICCTLKEYLVFAMLRTSEGES